MKYHEICKEHQKIVKRKLDENKVKNVDFDAVDVSYNGAKDTLIIEYQGFKLTATIPPPDQNTSNHIWSTIVGAGVALFGVLIGVLISKSKNPPPEGRL